MESFKNYPYLKKGNVHQIENYRPIANLCSASKIFERLILKQIHYLENKNSLDLTGKQQHGFKKNKVKGHEPRPCEAPWLCWSFLKIYFIKLKGLNKQLTIN